MDRKQFQIAVEMGLERHIEDSGNRELAVESVMIHLDMMIRMEAKARERNTQEIPLVGTGGKTARVTRTYTPPPPSELPEEEPEGDVIDEGQPPPNPEQPTQVTTDLHVSSLRSNVAAKSERPWELPELLAFLEQNTPSTMKIDVEVEGELVKVRLERNIISDPIAPGGGSVKLMYYKPGVPLEAFEILSIMNPRKLDRSHPYSQLTRNIDVDALMKSVYERAKKVFVPRPETVESSTPLDNRPQSQGFAQMLSTVIDPNTNMPKKRDGTGTTEDTRSLAESRSHNAALRGGSKFDDKAWNSGSGIHLRP